MYFWLWLRIAGKTSGPFGRKLVRHSLHLGWLPRETEIADDSAGPWSASTDDEMLWSESNEIIGVKRSFTEGGVSPAEKVQISQALRQRLQAMGWPGDVSLLKNYYWADRLRKELEEMFPDPTRPPFDDPDWPSCWFTGCPAAIARQEAERRAGPISERQIAVLRFFSRDWQGLNTGQASDIIEKLLKNPKRRKQWEAARNAEFSAEPATEAQLYRLQFAATKLQKALPADLTKQQARDLIDEWFQGHSDLEGAYHEYKDKIRLRAMIQGAPVEDWRHPVLQQPPVLQEMPRSQWSPPQDIERAAPRSWCLAMIGLVIVLSAAVCYAALRFLGTH